MRGEEGIVARGVLRGMGGGGGYGHGGYGYGGYAPAAYRPMMYGGGQPIIIDRSPPNWGSGEYRGYGHGGGGYGAARYGVAAEPPGILERLARIFLGGERAVPPAGSPVYVPHGRPTSYREIQGYAPSPATVYAQQAAAQPPQAPALRVQGAEDVTSTARVIPVTPPAIVEERPLGGYSMCMNPAISTNVPLGRAFQAATGETPTAPSRLQGLAAGKEHGGFDQETYARALKSLPVGPSPS